MKTALLACAAGVLLLSGCGGGGGGGSNGSPETGGGGGTGGGAATLKVLGISAGWEHTCAVVETDGGETNVKCWGSNAHGELGNGTTTDSPAPVTVLDADGSPLTGVKAVSASRYYTCALMNDGGVKCWGWNEGGKLGDGKVDKSQPLFAQYANYIPFGDEKYATKAVSVYADADATQKLSGVEAVSAGSWHACAKMDDGTVKCWGQNFDGALGIGKDPEDFNPFNYADRNEWKKLFAPYAVTVVESNTSSSPLRNVVQVAAGSCDHTCALLGDGRVTCWAWNGGEDGELGIDDTNITYATAPVSYVVDETGAELTGVTEIAAGGDFTCALLPAGGVKCWGWNVAGQLGDGTTASRPHAVAVVDENGAPLTGVKHIYSERGNHACALMNDGSLKCWGDNTHGQLGVGTIGGYEAHAVTANINADIVAVAAGGGGRDPLAGAQPDQYQGDHTCVVTADGKVWCWGSNTHGQLGDGTTTDRADPVKVEGL
jgi:alpha-tubulin suppressor-like RCC1 family protein